ncbi:hypothetical protein TIFTF001_024672 [Ficus carica]|uniref:Uncharacterized protein n=1 Tax=Ficus carica TaxID=3494 RepID=A0AA88DGZ7_FICCA|nr:hypothetical protein TIFTF001_024672 [Ficus carica]
MIESSSLIFSHAEGKCGNSPIDPRHHLVVRPRRHCLEIASVSSSLTTSALEAMVAVDLKTRSSLGWF